MSLIISGSFHHLKNCFVIRANLNKLIRFHSTKQPLNKTRHITTRADLTQGRPHSSPPHKINFQIEKTTILHQQIESIQLNEPEKNKGKTDWPATFLVFDIETTGFNNDKQRIIEVGICDLQGGDKSSFESLVNPGIHIPNSQIHGITTNMVNHPRVPTFKQLIPAFMAFVKMRQIPGKPVVWIAHNGKRFDFSFLKRELRINGFDFPDDWLFLDTLPLAKELPIEGSKSLESLRIRYKVTTDGQAHRALADVNDLCKVFAGLTFDLKLSPSDIVKRSFSASEIN